MEEIEYLLLNNINVSLLKDELLKFNMELKYVSVTKNIDICNNYQLRLYCTDNRYYYIYLDGTNNFKYMNDLFYIILNKEYMDIYIDYLIELRKIEIDRLKKKKESINDSIEQERKHIKRLKNIKVNII